MPEETQNEARIRVRRAEVDSICIYDVTEDELDSLERGSPASLYLNFSLFLLSSAISFLTSILLTEIKSQKTFTVFVVIIVVGFVVGLILLKIWHRDYKSSKSTSKKIRDRLKAEILPKKEGSESIEPANC